VFWQYGSQLRIGTQSDADCNAFRGSVADLRTLIMGDDMGVEEWTASPGANSWALTQGSAGYVGQQRDTALAFAWQSAHDANEAAKGAKASADAAAALCQQILDKLNAGGTSGGVPAHTHDVPASSTGPAQ